MDDATPARVQHFRQNCLAWAALAHFLPANLLREFCYAIVDLVSAGQFKLPELFEERLFASTEGLDRWEIRPREVSDPLSKYLQLRVRTFAWGNDSYVTFEESLAAESGIKPAFLENAVRLGISDFSSPESWIEQVTFPLDQASILVMRDNIAKVRLSVDSPENPLYRSIGDAIVPAVDMPLAAVMIKHLGDLCADADRWKAALSFYEQSKTSLAKCDRSVWGPFCDALTILTTQSIAAALRSAQGPRTAADYLRPIIEVASLYAASLLIENATQDAYVAASLGSEGQFIPDLRAHLVPPPLFLSSHDLDSALQASINEEYTDAHRCFWQVLRRQIALGSASESRLTKAFYARSVFEELDKIGTRDHKPASFRMAVRLLIESGQSAIAQRVSWSEELIRSYVDHDFLQATIAHAQKYGSASGERLITLVEMLNGWAEVTIIEQADVAHTMIHFLAATAIENPSSFYGWKDVGGKSIEYIRQLAEKRPEFRIGTADRVTAAIVVKLQRTEWWTGVSEALSAANVYAEVLSEENMTKLVTATLSLLNPIDPAKNAWVIVQPALNFLSSQAVKQWSVHQHELAERVITTILRFGVRQQTEHARLLFFLTDFDVSLLGTNASSSDLAEVVADVRRKAKTTNSSNAVDNIRALFVCPALAGAEGVQDALQSLESIIESALAERTNLSFPASYAPLQMLAERCLKIAEALSIDRDVFCARLETLLALVKRVWAKAKDDPMIFAQFSLPPPTKPNAVVVHNWAFASISLAKMLGHEDEMLNALAVAAEHPQLAGSISTARATRLAAGDFEEMDAVAIEAEDRETFYAVLGQRLVRVRSMVRPEPIVKAFLNQCLRNGPNGLDAAVLLLAADWKLDGVKDNPHFANYERRLQNSRDLRRVLSPLLHALSEASKDK